MDCRGIFPDHTVAGQRNYQIGLLRRFDFSSKLQRSSVIVKNFGDMSYRAYIKGSPEMIAQLSVKESMPENFEEILNIYTESGYRVLGLGHKPLPGIDFMGTQKIARDEIEKDIWFLGFLVMQNKLKPVTTTIIQTLNAAKIRTIMATGDNVLTAIAVGKECGIVDPDIEVFLGDLRKEGNEDVVFWKSTK
jgi:cation-transporting ATPase 13A2